MRSGVRGKLRALVPVVVLAAAVAGAGAAVQDASAAPEVSGSPPFAVVLTVGVLAVESAQTQHVEALVPPPHGMYWASVAAAGGGTTFVAAASVLRSSCGARFYLLTLSANGRPTGLRPMDVPAISGIIHTPTSLAASQNGRMIAYAMLACTNNTINSIVLISGKVRRQWSLPPEANPTSMSLSADGSMLGFVDSSADEQGPPMVVHIGAAWVLPTGARPGSAFSRGRKVYRDGDGTAVSIALSADGRTAYVTANTGPGTVLAAYRTSTGTMLSTLHSWPLAQLIFAGLTIGGDSLVTWDDFHPAAYRVSLATGSVTRFRLYSRNGQPAEDIAWLPGWVPGQQGPLLPTRSAHHHDLRITPRRPACQKSPSWPRRTVRRNHCGRSTGPLARPCCAAPRCGSSPPRLRCPG